jgi:bifunctional DNase/RNase
MRNAKRTILIAMLICVGFVPVCLARTPRSKTKPKRPTAFELLVNYAETQEITVESTTVRKASGK